MVVVIEDRVKYARTNENLESIVRGLDINPQDYILVVGGSGDQAFALLEHVKRVMVVDIEYHQVAYIREQTKSLRQGDYKGFLRRRLPEPIWDFPEPDLTELFEVEKRLLTKYFNKERLDRIRKRLSTLEIREADVLDVCQNEIGFNKVYLSNALGGHPNELGPKLKIISQSLPPEGLVYASNGETIKDALYGGGLVFDEFLTSRTYDEEWHPIVLRKTRDSKLAIAY